MDEFYWWEGTEAFNGLTSKASVSHVFMTQNRVLLPPSFRHQQQRKT